MRWDVRGVNRETDAEVALQVEAKSQSEAIAKAREAGVLVKSAWPIRPPLSPAVDTATRTATRTVTRTAAPKPAPSLLPTDDDLEAIAAAAETALRPARALAAPPATTPAASPAPVPLSVAPPPVPVTAPRPAEVPILQTPAVTVTSARIIIGATTYAVAGVTSVQPRFIPATRVTESLTLVAGVMFTLSGYAVSRQPPGTAAVACAIAILYAVGALCPLAALLAWRRNRPKYAVRLATPSGERDVLVSEDQRWVQAVVRAINQAIISRR
jgi:hypothetical protein